MPAKIPTSSTPVSLRQKVRVSGVKPREEKKGDSAGASGKRKGSHLDAVKELCWVAHVRFGEDGVDDKVAVGGDAGRQSSSIKPSSKNLNLPVVRHHWSSLHLSHPQHRLLASHLLQVWRRETKREPSFPVFDPAIDDSLWKTLAQAKGATSIGTPCFQLVPSTLESLRESATRMKLVAASASTFSRSWQAPPPLQGQRDCISIPRSASTRCATHLMAFKSSCEERKGRV